MTGMLNPDISCGPDDHSLLAQKPFQGFKQNVRFHRFAQVRVQACLHTSLHILIKGISR